MRRIILISLCTILLILISFLLIIGMSNNQTPTTYPITFLFSKEADEAFVSSLVESTDVNSGITMEKATTAFPDQANNITFAVFNHTDEPIIFPNQGYGLTIFTYDDSNKRWESLKLQYVPYPESTTLPPKLEKWDFDTGNSWSILEDETTAWGAEHLRIYVSGKGETTNKVYSAYLDVSISLSP